jgi:hypothetical protein
MARTGRGASAVYASARWALCRWRGHETTKEKQMQPADALKVLRFLNQQAGFEETYQVTVFTGFRPLEEDGSIKLVTVQILDAGENADHPRFQVSVQDEDGRTAHGEPADTLDEVLANVHWFHLDEPPSEDDEDEDEEM